MEKQKRWHLVVILLAIALTVYNILPTLFFYTKPLKSPIDKPRAEEVARGAAVRVNAMEKGAVDWIHSFNKTIGAKAKSVVIDENSPGTIRLTFATEEGASRFRTLLPKAGALIPFVPAQLSLAPSQELGKEVTVKRAIATRFDTKKLGDTFTFSEKKNKEGAPTPLYRAIIEDRITEIAMAAGGPTENALLLGAILHAKNDPRVVDYTLRLADNINTYAKLLGADTPLAKKFYSTFTQGEFASKMEAANGLLAALDTLTDSTRSARLSLEEKEKKLRGENNFLEAQEIQSLEMLRGREQKLSSAGAIVKKHTAAFAAGATPWTDAGLAKTLRESAGSVKEGVQTLDLAGRNPIISALAIDWETDKVSLTLRDSVAAKRAQSDDIDQLIYGEIARLARLSGETISPTAGEYEIALSALPNSQSFLALDLGAIAKSEAEGLKSVIEEEWQPTHKDLQRAVFPIWSSAEYAKLSAKERQLGLVIYAPTAEKGTPPQGFRMGSVYVIAKGVDQILKKLEATPEAPQAKEFIHDFTALRDILQQNGFYGYPGTTYPLSAAYAKDFVFEAEESCAALLKATRENFEARGSKRYAVLEFTNVEQRILATNKIENAIHEDLLKWKDEYNAAKVDPEGHKKFEIPAPTKSPLLSNLALSARKYFRGDERKILHWGLDMAGGKTVQIELRDNANRVVKDDADIKQGINELYARVNKMGVSEVSIRQEGSGITLDFPGAQGFSASELVKASSMYFHVVNEKFGPSNPLLADAANRFLQEVWNEAVVTGKKDSESVNLIAWNHLYGDVETSPQPRSEAARTLYDNGLRLAHPNRAELSSAFNDTFSRLALYRGDTFKEWHGQANPLLIVFNNYALEGSNLEQVRSSYDPSKGNYLSFNVRSSQAVKGGQKISPRAELYNWTSTFSKEKVTGTPLESFSSGRGWRMAVILNGSVISAPTLDSALRDSAMISGSFTQREVNKLEADLKAGSLTFAPRILSEKNVSPELGVRDRTMGIVATIVALALVIALMVGYYRFSGVIASIAVLFNLLIMWATLQNINATMTLAGIAAIILTMGMAVDANVLVFERIREEFKRTGRISQAVGAGYKKAFSAIIDSNVTTIIAAIILLNFDSGPIKGFAVTMIIGIVSSMFTALFMTRYFFGKWVENPKHKALKMSELIRASKFDFLKYSKAVMIGALAIMIAGAAVLGKEKSRIMGMDFTGGFALNVELEQKANVDYRAGVEKALLAAGVNAQDVQVRELTPANHVRIFLGKAMEQPGKPFAGMPLETSREGAQFAYENNPRIVWVAKALEEGGFTLSEKAQTALDKNWTSVSGQMSDAMRNNALLGLALALLCIFLYITVRFEFKYAMSATLALTHDVLVTIGLIALLNKIGVPVQIDLNTIAALMTIVGYSLNDTIVIFDRIREDVKGNKKLSFRELINTALNTTLSRTVMTSATTFIVLLALVTLGGSTIFGFALVMSLGVIIGTLSSLFVAAPLLQLFDKREQKALEPNGATR